MSLLEFICGVVFLVSFLTAAVSGIMIALGNYNDDEECAILYKILCYSLFISFVSLIAEIGLSHLYLYLYGNLSN